MTCSCYCINMQNGFTALHILYAPPVHLWGFPHGSVGKESSRNAGDPCSIPGLGRSPGEGIGYPLQYSWASLMAQLVKNLPAMWETWVWSLSWEDSPGEGKGYPLQYPGLENSMDHTVHTVHGVAKSRTWLSDFHFHLFISASPLVPGSHLSFHCLHSFAFSRMSYSENYIVGSLSDWLLSLVCT